MVRSTTFETEQEWDCWLPTPLPPLCPSNPPIALNGARGSFGWFDRGRRVERGARSIKVHDR